MQASDATIPSPFPPRRICILGAGQFGRLAAQRLGRRYPEASFLVVDEHREKLEGLEGERGLSVLAENLEAFLENTRIDREMWIVPALPIHFAFQWIFHELKRNGRAEHLPIPADVEAQIPNPYRAASGSICASFATFICPDNCSEPDEMCTYTRNPRPGNLFEELARMAVSGFEVLVVRSWQLAPGVGGYPGECLAAVLNRIMETLEGCYLIATSCRCHGVIDALSWENAAKS